MDFRSREHFLAACTAPLQAARAARLIRKGSIAVFPEHIGLFLHLMDEWEWVYHASTVEAAGTRAILDEKIWLAAYGLKAPEGQRADAIRAEYLRIKAPTAARHYQEAFRRLAEQFAVTLVAGSIPLPGPSIEAGIIRASGHPTKDMRNVSAVFAPSGELLAPLVTKRHPTAQEGESLWMNPPPDGELPIFETDAGRLAVLICADSWHPDAWEAVSAAEIIACPAFLPDPLAWKEPWQGYSIAEGGTMPAVSGNEMTEAEAWMEHGFGGRILGSSARAGVASFLKGSLWNLRPGGQVIASLNGESRMLPSRREATVTAVHL